MWVEASMRNLSIMTAVLALTLGGCAVAKTTGAVITAPVKLAGKTAELTGKTAFGATKMTGKAVVGTGEITGKTVIGTGKLAGKAVVGTGKGIYYIGSTPVHIANGALDTSYKVLRLTTQTVDLTGKVVSVSRDIQAIHLETELLKYRGAANVLAIAVDALR